MTRYLSLALGAEEPIFSQSIQQLEQASGAPNADIRLSTHVMQQSRSKIAELGLDPKDTTGPELYAALHQRLGRDEIAVRRALAIDDASTSMDILARVEQCIATLEVPNQCFALKASVAKRLLKKKVPKNVMKRLGYRSMESMLKHESVAQLYAAALMVEPALWHKAFKDQYATLQPGDFESRPMVVSLPRSKRWNELAATFVPTAKHNILTFKELGAVIILPLEDAIDGLTITTLLVTLHEMNDIRSYSSYVKLQQVKPDFGVIMQQATLEQPQIAAKLAGQQVTWQTIHRYYARFKEAYHAEVFEPHVQPEDLHWQNAEDLLAKLAPTLHFWQGTQYLSFLDKNNQPVSCNMLDMALSYCNKLSFTDRIVHFVRDNLWHELLLQYLNQHNLEEAVQRQLSNNLFEGLPLAD